jgi:hypothetical protein
VEPGLLGFLVVAGLGVILVFLFRSMNKQFKKIPPPEEPGDSDQAEDRKTPTAAETTEANGAKRG